MLRRTALCWLALVPLLALDLFPFAVMLATALKPTGQLASRAPGWLPTRLAWENFAIMWEATGFGGALLNSFAVAALASLASILVSVPAAYALSRHRSGLRRSYGSFLLVTQMLPPVLLVLGLFQIVAWAGLTDSKATLALIYACFQIAFAVWLLRSYFDAIPREYEEAARIDGASRLRALWSIFLPLSLPAILVTGIFGFITSWNEFALALTLLRNQKNFTLPIQIFSLVAGRYEVEWNYVMAAALAATLPVAAIFACFQRYLVRGLRIG